MADDDKDNDDKTQDASAQRLRQAREDGRAPLSREVAGLAVLVAGSMMLSLQTPAAVREAAGLFQGILAQSYHLEAGAALHMASRALMLLALPIAIAAAMAAAAGVLLQTGFLIHLSAVTPDFGRVSPLSGLKRVFGAHNLMQAAKSILKVAVVGFAGWSALSGALPLVMQALDWTPGRLVEQIWAQLAAVLVAMLGAYGLFTAADVLKTRHSFFSGLKMTKQEQRDEMKDADGDPHIKGKQKQIRMQRARRRMMAAVPKATVVVTNPTHYAVALSYDRANGGAPRIVAKGMDDVAARIRAVAEEAGVPLVANPPLARALYPMKLGSEIPPEHFKAVAELIAYVWRLKTPRARPAA